MSNLISREKEFLKLNEKLNLLTAEAHEMRPQQQQQQQLRGSAVSGFRREAHATTYTKCKDAILKKRGAGDGIPDPQGAHDTPLTICHTDRSRANSAREARRSTGLRSKAQPPHHSTSSAAKFGLASIIDNSAAVSPRDLCSISTATTTRIRNVVTTSTHRSRNSKLDSARSTSSRASSHRSSGATSSRSTKPNSEFTICYQNPKFVTSPSLEALVRNGTGSLRNHDPTSYTLIDVESECSVFAEREERGASGGVISTATRASRGSLSNDGLIKFLKSKVAILEADHSRISQDMTQQKQLLEVTLDRQKKIEQQRDLATSRNTSLTEQLAKTELQLEDANRRVKERVNEHSFQQKDVEAVKRELRVLSQTNNLLEKRLVRANEELESAKSALSKIRCEERALRETMRCECEGRDKQIKSLKKQRADLLNAYKKQLFLIDNLKRQNVCMEQSKMLNFNEKEFTKVLQWKTT